MYFTIGEAQLLLIAMRRSLHALVQGLLRCQILDRPDKDLVIWDSITCVDAIIADVTKLLLPSPRGVDIPLAPADVASLFVLSLSQLVSEKFPWAKPATQERFERLCTGLIHRIGVNHAKEICEARSKKANA